MTMWLLSFSFSISYALDDAKIPIVVTKISRKKWTGRDGFTRAKKSRATKVPKVPGAMGR